ncbi:MAG: RHS repeat-associated core domain-containing protein, partial [Gammaproteobacteria bacterium]|nr:RHS repeat-associated core domain-containing protein [Gammaproteobacteria bacterium]
FVSRSGALNGLSASSTSYMHQDHLSSVAVITDESGAVVERLAYDPWGKRRKIDGNPDKLDALVGVRTDRGYTMHEHLDEVGIIHMNGRIYDPLIGRFMSADPYVQAPTNLKTFNRYSYVWNNPLRFYDPEGFNARDCFGDKCFVGDNQSDQARYQFQNGIAPGPNDGWSVSSGSDPNSPAPRTVKLQDVEVTGKREADPGVIVFAGPALTTLAWGGLAATGGHVVGRVLVTGAIAACVASGPCLVGAAVVAVGTGVVLAVNNAKDVKPADEAKPPDEVKDDGGDNNNKPDPPDGKDLKKLSPGEIKGLKEDGLDIHEVKGKGSSRYDLYKDSDGRVYQMLKGGRGEPQFTGITL